MNVELADIEFASLDDSDNPWEPTVLPNLRPSVDFGRDLTIDVENAGSDLLDRATESPPHLLIALPWFAS